MVPFYRVPPHCHPSFNLIVAKAETTSSAGWPASLLGHFPHSGECKLVVVLTVSRFLRRGSDVCRLRLSTFRGQSGDTPTRVPKLCLRFIVPQRLGFVWY